MGHKVRAPALALAIAIASAATPQSVPSRPRSGSTQPPLSSDPGRVSRAKTSEGPLPVSSARPPARGSSLGCPTSGARSRPVANGKTVTFSTFAQTSSASLSPEGRDLSQRVGASAPSLTITIQKSAIRYLCHELTQNTIMHSYRYSFRPNSHWVSSQSRHQQ